MKYDFLPVSDEETELLYSSNNYIRNEEIGCIGRLRANFGPNGDRFHSTWMDVCPEIKTKLVSDELDVFINTHREDGILKKPRCYVRILCGELTGKIGGRYLQRRLLRLQSQN